MQSTTPIRPHPLRGRDLQYLWALLAGVAVVLPLIVIELTLLAALGDAARTLGSLPLLALGLIPLLAVPVIALGERATAVALLRERALVTPLSGRERAVAICAGAVIALGMMSGPAANPVAIQLGLLTAAFAAMYAVGLATPDDDERARGQLVGKQGMRRVVRVAASTCALVSVAALLIEGIRAFF